MVAVETKRYHVLPPDSRQDDPHSWRIAVHNAAAQLEHQALRMANLSLVNEYGTNAWLLHNRSLEASQARLEREVAAVRHTIESLNIQRKAEQIKGGEVLVAKEWEWMGMVNKNMAIDRACVLLQDQVLQLQPP
eukprot:TRINITY_DN1616_c0_g1_i4.p1 TRINITY_DN1616_c0_g1~~TRINITY_DN1616_c0_g1_i4.p1  ORF type:complete len:151 (-),score=22.06 TRINITY_DN1616_c0_g1_i4:169-570(-)